MKRIFIIVLTLLIAMIGLGFWYWQHQKPTTTSKAKATLVSVTKANIETIPFSIKATGQVIAPQTIMLKTQVAGTVSGIFFKSGELVIKNQLLVQLDPTEAKATAAEKYANFLNLKTQYQRFAKLAQVDKDAVAPNVLSQKQSDMNAAKALWLAAKKQLANTQIRAPFAGTIGSPQAMLNHVAMGGTAINETAQLNVGTYLPQGSPIAILSNTKHMLVKYQIPQIYSKQLKLGQPISVKIKAFPTQTFKGQVSYISPMVLQNTQAYNIEAYINDPNNSLRSGMNAMISQVLNSNRKILTVPGLSLVPSLAGYSVYTIENNKVRSLPVKIGQRFNTRVAIKSGLKAGETIIATGSLNINPGMSVRIK